MSTMNSAPLATGTGKPPAVGQHRLRDRGVRARIFGLSAVLLLGLLVSTGAGQLNGSRASDLKEQADAAVEGQRQVEAARYNLLWAANWQHITAGRARGAGGAAAGAPGPTPAPRRPHRAETTCPHARTVLPASRSCSTPPAACSTGRPGPPWTP